MMKFTQKKSTYGYIKNQKKIEIIKTIVMFGISISLYIAGYATTHTNKNLLTLAAVLGCLPASKSAVNMIMFLRAKGCSEYAYDKIQSHVGSLMQRYDLFLTTYSKNFQISHVVMKNKNLIGYTESDNFDETALNEHLTNVFHVNGYKDITVKIFKDLDKYLERMDSLNESKVQEQTWKVEEVLHLMENLSL